MLISALGGCDPMPVRPRRIVPDMLLMPALQISNPVKALIQMVINDSARSALRLRVQSVTCIYSTLFLRRVPDRTQNPGSREPVPLVTDSWSWKGQHSSVRKNEVANAGFMVGRAAYRRRCRSCASFTESERGCRQRPFDARTLQKGRF